MTASTTKHWSRISWLEKQTLFNETWQPWFAEQRERRGLGIKHPVWDFLFEYYRVNRNRVERWHPPVDEWLEGVDVEQFAWVPGFETDSTGGMLSSENIDTATRRRLEWIRGLLQATLNRSPRFQCFGMHEWAMVYRSEVVRHDSTPLRLSPERIAEVVEARKICCTHYDAFRFFTPAARPLNTESPTQDTRYANEQHGCVHVNMDLYKWCYKAFPWISSDCQSDSLTLAMDARALDMRASPYDVSSLGFEPIPIETREGSAAYQAQQTALTQRGQNLAQRVVNELNRVLG